MPDTVDRRGLSELVGHCLRPPKSDRHRVLPIVAVWGPRRGGKSELLDYLYERFYPGRPCVRRTKHELENLRRPYEVAVALAFHLSRHVEGFGRLKFPRLFLGVAAIRGSVTIEDPEATRAAMIRRTVPDRKRLRSLARETADSLADVVGVGRGMRFFLGLAVDGAGALVETVLALGGRGRKWYQDGLGQHFADPIDALVRLAEQETNPQRQDRVDEVLCRAFLADLREEYSPRALQLFKRDQNCLAILDDADSDVVRRFLDVLVAQRRNWDPLLIVSATATRSPFTGQRHPERWVVRDVAVAGYQDWHKGRAGNEGWAGLYPVALGGITLEEARTHFAGHADTPRGPEVAATGILGDAEKVLRFAHRLTDGHLGGMGLVLDAMSLERRRVGAENVDVRDLFTIDVRNLFTRPDTADNTWSLAQEIQRLLVGGWSVDLHRPLLRSAAARDFGEPSLAAVLKSEPAAVAHMMHEFRSRDLWVRHPPGPNATDPPTLHPFPRRAVVHLLAKPPGQNEPTWDEVHHQLRTHAEQREKRNEQEERQDQTSAMYHRLALGGISAAAKHLSALLASEDTRTWYDALTAITRAPLAQPGQEANSQQHWERLVKKVDDGLGEPAELVKLVAALQLHIDPLGDPGHHLCIVIAHELESLARRSSAFFFLLEKAEEFRDCWKQWHQD
ncbi:MAG: hypothetical protein ACRDTG_33060 [Pseudonocardiaceae bacterium]